MEKQNSLRADLSRLIYVKGGITTVPHPDPIAPPGATLTVSVPAHYALERQQYVARPTDPVRQQLSVYIPAAYLEGKSIRGYTRESAPVLFYVEGGGFRFQKIITPTERTPACLALQRGYILVSANFRGCQDGSEDPETGKTVYTGKAPAQLVDLKAAIRWLNFNADLLPGDYSKLIITGGSSGGGLTSLLGVSAGADRFDQEMEALGAAPGTDDAFACGAYYGLSQVKDLDGAYDWYFARWRYETAPLEISTFWGPKQIQVAARDEKGVPVLKPAAEAPYSPYAAQYVDQVIQKRFGMTEGEYVCRLLGYILPAYQEYRIGHPEACIDHPFYFNSYEDYLAAGNGPDPYYRSEQYPGDGGYLNFDLFRAYISAAAYKASPCSDVLTETEMEFSENLLFGDRYTKGANFTPAGMAAAGIGCRGREALIAEQVGAFSVQDYLECGGCTPVRRWYIRHGTHDGDIPLPMSLNLAMALEKAGVPVVDFRAAFGVGHGESLNGLEEADAFLNWCDNMIWHERQKKGGTQYD